MRTVPARGRGAVAAATSPRGARLRAAWAAGPGSLTARGTSLVLAGVLAGGPGVVLGHRDLVRLAVLLLALPLAAWAVARSARPALVVERTVSPGVVPVGGSASVRLDLHGRGRGGRSLLAEDVVPPALRASPRFVVERLPAGTSASVRYGLVGARRGRHPVGPLHLVAQDPFGLVALTRSTRAVDPLLVVPAVQQLPAVRVRGSGAGSSSVDPGPGEDDVVPREYRPGDDRRRVHWRTSARRGELMVRRDERPRRAGAAVLLDRGAGDVVGDDDGPGREAFERAVTAAASATERLARDGLAVRLLLGAPGDAVRADVRGRLGRLERLALVAPEPVPTAPAASPPRTDGARPSAGPGAESGAGSGDGAGADARDAAAPLDAALEALRRHREDVLVAVCGPSAAELLTGAAARHRLALVVARGDDGPDDAAAARAVRTLVRAGWGAAVLGPADDLAVAWTAAQRRGRPAGSLVSGDQRPGGREGVPPGAPSALAGAAVLGSASTLLPLVDGPGWFVDAVVVVAVVGLVGLLLDALTSSSLVRAGAQSAAALTVLTALYAPGSGVLGLLPGPSALASGWLLLEEGREVIRTSLPPVVDPPGLRLVVVGGTAVVAVAVDVLAVRLGRVTAAGLPLLALVGTAAALQRGGLPVPAFVAAVVPFLLLLRAESRWRESRWGRTATRWRHGGGRVAGADPPVAAVATTAALALAAALVVPALGPWHRTGLMSWQGWGGAGAGTGPGGARVNPLLSLAEDLDQRSDATALTYRLEDRGVATEPLRLVTVDVFDGDTWRPREDGDALVPLEDGELPPPPGLDVEAALEEGSAVPQSLAVTVEALRQEYLPAPYPATSVALDADDGDWAVKPGTLDLVGEGRTTTLEGQEYAVQSLRLVPEAADLVEVGAPPASVRTTWTDLPEGLPPEIGALAAEVAGEGEPLQQAARLQAFFREDGGFTYSEQAPGGTGAGSVAAFLERRSGYCVHYASAMALMARSLGLPSRVSVGFLPGARRVDGSYRVSLRDAHSWPEVYLGGSGWVRFEPTPGVRTGGAPAWTGVAAADAAVAARDEPDAAVPAPAPVPDAAGAPAPPEGAGATPDAPPAERGAGPAAVAGVGSLALLLALLPAVLARLRRRARWRACCRAAAAGSSAAVPERAEDDLRRGLADLGVPVDPAATPRVEEARRRRLVGLGEPGATSPEDAPRVLVTSGAAGGGGSASTPVAVPLSPADPVEATPPDDLAVRLRRRRDALEASRYLPPPAAHDGEPRDAGLRDRGPRDEAGRRRAVDDEARRAREDVDLVLAAVALRAPRGRRWRARLLPLAHLRR